MQDEPKYLVVANRGLDTEDIFYCGDSELMAFKRLRELTCTNKEILKATIKMATMFGEFELIESYEVIEKIA